MIDEYGGVAFLLLAALLLFARSVAKGDEMAAYVAHAMTGLAALILVIIGLGTGPRPLAVAAVALFVGNFAFLVRRLRHS